MHSCVLGLVLFVSVVSPYAYTYDPNTTLNYFLKSIWRPLTIYLDKYLIKIPFSNGRELNQIITK